MFNDKDRATDASIRLHFLLSGLADYPKDPLPPYLEMEDHVRGETVRELKWLLRYTQIQYLGTVHRWIDMIHEARCGHVEAWTGHVSDKLSRGIKASEPVLHEKQGTLPLW